ncbi:MAG TPA: CpsD/CapB family tyrosine-protein kinase [Candidatus Blautia stercorigallinarum]|uniref:non-specific protein-tyrosine kinase n=1 Tax=Candidatus Blautia stercorigallinarum TaxID=2838501 RepID=A0A9D1PDN4_9FIRM|nr:CpsD/CapB family tyrosine-protein kinase [Candidatus Blautia stercorigallinarum]
MEQRVTLTDPRKLDYYYEEAIKTLRTNIQFSGRDIKTIMFTSCFPNEGKSDTLIQLAKEIGKAGKKVLLIDADIRKSTFIRRYHVRQSVKGLSQYLSGQVEQLGIYYSTNFENMDMIFAGPMAPNPSELLEERAFDELLATARQVYDYVLIDTPPVLEITDASIVARKCDGAVLVIESGRVKYRDAQKAQEQLKKSGCSILGAVLNKVQVRKDKYYSSYYGYGK